MRNETVGILPNKIFYLMLSASMNLQFEIVFLGKLQLFNNRIIRLRKSIMWPRSYFLHKIDQVTQIIILDTLL